MANTIQVKRSGSSGSIPSSLAAGELALNTADQVLYSSDGATVFRVGAGTSANPIPASQGGTGVTNTNNIPVTATGSTFARTLADRFASFYNIKDFGAVGDGTTNDTAAISNAESNSPVFVPTGTYLTTVSNTSQLIGKQYGFGQIKTADGNKSAPNFSMVSSAPASFGNESSILTAFNGDWSKSQMPTGCFVSGATTLGQPTSGYLYTPEVTPFYTYLFNSSGWNQSTTGNGGRTAITAYRTKVDQYGQGDAVCYNGSVFVTGTKAGSTNFLANPAGVLFNGDMTAGADGVYLNPYETFLSDNGYDVAAIGLVNNFARSISTGAKSTVWMGYRAQNVGSAYCDALISATGRWVTGLDLAMTSLDFGTTKAAISLKQNDRIYLNNAAIASGNLTADWRTTVFNGDYLEYNTGISAIQFVRGGSSKLQIGSSTVVVANASLAVNTTGTGVNSAYIRDLQTGFGLPTGTVNSNTFDTSTVTLTQLAQYVAALVQHLHSSTSGAHWLIGP